MSLSTPSASPSPASRPFRSHTHGAAAGLSQPTEGPGELFTQLGQEWTRLCALPSLTHTLRRWGRTEPALAGVETLGALVDQIDGSTGQQEDQMLLALVRLTQTGQQMAGRVLLQAMLPKIATMVRRMRPSSNDDRWVEDRRQIAVATFWEVLQSYPAQRRQSRVAANLALDTLHELTRGLRRPPVDIPVDPDDASARLASRSYLEPRMSSDGLTADSDLVEVISWALSTRAISSEEAALLVRVYLPDAHEDPRGAGIAGELSLSHAALRQRCSRARRRLIEAVHADAVGQTVTAFARVA